MGGKCFNYKLSFGTCWGKFQFSSRKILKDESFSQFIDGLLNLIGENIDNN